MKSTIKWHKEFVNGKWYSVANVEHVPMIEHLKDGDYKVRNCNGKSIIHREFSDAVKLALETYKKFSKFNKKFDEKGAWQAVKYNSPKKRFPTSVIMELQKHK